MFVCSSCAPNFYSNEFAYFLETISNLTFLIVREAERVRKEGNGKRNSQLIHWLESCGQTKQGNGNYLAGLLIALELNEVYIWERLRDHTQTHTSNRKEITNEMMFDLEWIFVSAMAIHLFTHNTTCFMFFSLSAYCFVAP